MQIDVPSLQNALGIPVLFFDEIDSTNLYCKEKIRQGIPFEGVVIASSQSNGQGRVGKTFYSPKGSGLYVTFSLKNERFLQRNITPAVALSACRSIERCFSVSCGVKWVNDIYIRHRKVGGILCQIVDEYVLIGIGINIVQPKHIPDELQNRLGWVTEETNDLDLATLVLSLYNNILQFAEISDGELLKEYRERCIHIGRDVEIEQNHSRISGKCLGIDDNFQLLIEINGKIQSFSSGFMILKI